MAAGRTPVMDLGGPSTGNDQISSYWCWEDFPQGAQPTKRSLVSDGNKRRDEVVKKHDVTVCKDDQLRGLCRTQSYDSGLCITLPPEFQNQVSSFSITAGSYCQFYDNANDCNTKLGLGKKDLWPGGWMKAENFKEGEAEFGKKEPWTTNVGGKEPWNDRIEGYLCAEPTSEWGLFAVGPPIIRRKEPLLPIHVQFCTGEDMAGNCEIIDSENAACVKLDASLNKQVSSFEILSQSRCFFHEDDDCAGYPLEIPDLSYLDEWGSGSSKGWTSIPPLTKASNTGGAAPWNDMVGSYMCAL